MTVKIFWNIEVNGTLYTLNAGNFGDGPDDWLYMEDAIFNHPYLSTIIGASYDNGLILKNKTSENLRIKLIPSSVPTQEMIESSSNPTFLQESDGSLVFCLSPVSSVIGENYFGIDIAGYEDALTSYSLKKDGETILEDVSARDLIDYFMYNRYRVEFYLEPR